MSSASDNGTFSSSGRSTPDDGRNSNNAARRSSTPAQAFLTPRFWANNQGNSNVPAQPAHANEASPFNSLPRRTSFGMAFGNGGRLSALSALGMSPSNNPALYGYPSTSRPPLQSSVSGPYPMQQHQPHVPVSTRGSSQDRDVSPSSMAAQQTARMRTLNESAVATPDSTPTPSVPSSPVQKPQKRSVCYLPGPDGLYVESRGRRRSEA